MAASRAEIVDQGFLAWLESLAQHGPAGAGDPAAAIHPGTTLTGATALQLFDSQIASRHLDLEARRLRATGQGYYTIGSSGHEGNVVLGALTRHTDPALLHYRSGALFVERARQVAGTDPVRDILLGMMAAADDPASGGRHKVFGSLALNVPPQTSTIASQLPKAVGVAYFHERAKRLGLPRRWPDDAIVLCSFGDASVNHAAALAGFNVASYIAERHAPLPLLFVCEDNGIGISVPTPPGGVARVLGRLPGVRYFTGDGLELPAAWDAAREAIAHVRHERGPAVLHLSMVRLLAHAGSDIETEYHTLEQIEATEACDPLRLTAARLVEAGVASPAALRDRYEAMRASVRAAAADAARRPKLTTPAAVVAPLAPRSTDRVQAEAERADHAEARLRVFGGADRLPERDKPRWLAHHVAAALADLGAKYPDLFVFGEDVGRKGGVYHATAELQARLGRERCFDTLLDETTILGLAIGAGYQEFLPLPEIQYLAYVHNALDQLRGEACSQQFFSNGQWRNPMVVRIASFGYQEGFGGHFHNDPSTAALRDIPGLVVATPSRGDDAVGMLRTCCAAAKVDGAVVAFLEPIALYMQKDLHAPGDGAWCFPYPAPGTAVPFGQARVYDADGADATGPGPADAVIITYANGVRLSLQAARRLRDTRKARIRVVDLRWLQPLDTATILAEVRAAKRVLVVDEGRRSGGVAEPVLACLAESLPGVRAARVTGADTYVPLGDAWRVVLPSRDSIAEAMGALLA